MNIKKTLAFISLITTALAYSALARDIYVAKSGSDTTGDGSQAAPYLSIGKAITASANGDTINVGAGIYTEPNKSISGKGIAIIGHSRDDTIWQAAEEFSTDGSGGRMISYGGNKLYVQLLKNLTFRHGNMDGYGGVILGNGYHKLVVDNCHLINNFSTTNGAVFAMTGVTSGDGGNFHFINCEISNNETLGSGGAIYEYGHTSTYTNCLLINNRAAVNGGFFWGQGNAKVQMYGCFATNNVAKNGGVFYGSLFSSGLVENSTFAYNIATNDSDWANSSPTLGGGVVANTYNYYLGTFRNCTFYGNRSAGVGGVSSCGDNSGKFAPSFSNCTFTANSATIRGGAIHNGARLYSTIVAGNSAPTGPDINQGGTSTTAAFNFIGSKKDNPFKVGLPNDNDSFVGSAAEPIDPKLGPLAMNGGLTPTCALLSGSIAIDKGSNPDGLLYDQRGVGFERVIGEGPDIGAYERGAGPPHGTILLIN